MTILKRVAWTRFEAAKAMKAEQEMENKDERDGGKEKAAAVGVSIILFRFTETSFLTRNCFLELRGDYCGATCQSQGSSDMVLSQGSVCKLCVPYCTATPQSRS